MKRFWRWCGCVRVAQLAMLLFVVLGLAKVTAAAETGNLRVGAARVDITQLMKADLPPTGKYEHEHINVRAIVIDNGVTRAALLNADQGHLQENIWDLASTQIGAELNCPAANIIISATHTHSSGAPEGNPGSDSPYVKQIVGAMVDAVKQAKARLEPARMGFGTGLSYLNVNRDAVSPESHLWTQAPNTKAYSDKTVAVLKFVRPDGSPIAVYVNYAMHAIDGYLVGFLSSDFPGAMSNYIEEAFPSKPIAIFSQSASGDQNPLYLRPSTNVLASRGGVAISGNDLVREPVEEPIRDKKVQAVAPDPAVRDRLERFIDSEGALLGEEVIRVMTLTTQTTGEARIWGSQKPVSCPGRKRTDSGREGMTGSYEDAAPVELRLGMLGIGDVALTSVNAEVYSRILQRLKAETPMANTVMVTIANGRANSGYIPDDESYGHKTFQVLGSQLKEGCAEAAISDGLTSLVQQYSGLSK